MKVPMLSTIHSAVTSTDVMAQRKTMGVPDDFDG